MQLKQFFLILVLAFISIFNLALADNSGVYKVEILIFTQKEGANASEDWLSKWDISKNNINKIISNPLNIMALSPVPNFQQILNINIRNIRSAGNNFYSIKKSLEKKDRRILFHKPFLLNITAKTRTLVLEAGIKNNSIPELLASFNISVGKYFHFNANAILNNFEQQTQASNYKSSLLIETRNMRSNELHYFDNPFFGILVKIDKLQKN